MKLCSALSPFGHVQECWAGTDTAPSLRKLPTSLAADAAGLLLTEGTCVDGKVSGLADVRLGSLEPYLFLWEMGCGGHSLRSP